MIPHAQHPLGEIEEVGKAALLDRLWRVGRP
jgi:hypothetical protein